MAGPIQIINHDRTMLNRLQALISLAFLVWSVGFIFRSSFLTLDGQRGFCLFDDAMISLRYAWNFAHGAGLVWNPGERIQGYTNLLATLLMVPPAGLLPKSLAVLAIQIANAFLLLGIAWTTAAIAGLLPLPAGRRLWLMGLAFVCALAYYPLNYWALMGMETGLLALLLLLAVRAGLLYVQQAHPAQLWRMGIWLGLACLTRNDALLFAAVLWGHLLLSARSGRRPLAPVLASAALTGAFVVAELTFRYAYYGVWLPNTYTLKLAGMPLAARLASGIGFTAPFLAAVAPLLAVILWDLSRRPRGFKALFLAIFLAALGYQVYVGGDAWAYWRLFSPTIPLLLLLFILAADHLLSDHLRLHAGLLVAVTFLALLWLNRPFLPELSLYRRPYQATANRDNVNTALALSSILAPDASVGVFWAGAIPYYTGLRAVDFLGKSDAYIARLPPDLSGAIHWSGMQSVPGHNKYDLNYSIVRQRPTYVQGLEWGQQDLTGWAQSYYTAVEARGVRLWLLQASPQVDWLQLQGQ